METALVRRRAHLHPPFVTLSKTIRVKRDRIPPPSDLVFRTRSAVARLAAFTDCTRAQDEALYAAVNETKDPARMLGWRKALDRSEVKLCETVGGELLSELGYELTTTSRDRVGVTVKMAYVGADNARRAVQRGRRVVTGGASAGRE